MTDASEVSRVVPDTSQLGVQDHDQNKMAAVVNDEKPSIEQEAINAKPTPAAVEVISGAVQPGAEARSIPEANNTSPEHVQDHDGAQDATGGTSENNVHNVNPLLAMQYAYAQQNSNHFHKSPGAPRPRYPPAPSVESVDEEVSPSTSGPNNLSAVEARHRDLQIARDELENAGEVPLADRVELERKLTQAKTRLRNAQEEERLYNNDAAVEDADDDDFDEKEQTPAPVVETPTRKRKVTAKITNPKSAKKAKVSKPASKPTKANKGLKSGAKKSTGSAPNLLNTSSLTSNDIFENYNATAHLPDQPTFSYKGTTDKKKLALKGLLTSLGRFGATDTTDVQNLDDAVSKFYGKGQNVIPTQDGTGWVVNGMTTPLKHYQVLGAGWMREREERDEVPRGGILADEMGLGKTLQMIACICNGKSRGGRGSAHTTLLVLPASLVNQWKGEIQKHTKERQAGGYGIKSVFHYKSSQHDKMFKNPQKFLMQHDIVIVTYHEVGKSYPKAQTPADLTTADQKEKWWAEQYDKLRGVLHRVHWQRIVLDEAHTIKNHSGHFSRACRALVGEHRWAITGTPILNTISEFYPYFKFLKYPHTGSIRLFTSNYCNQDDSTGMERLNIVLRKIMIRRTTKDTMFGSRLLSLPKPSSKVIWVKFNAVERACYDIVKKRFITRINAISASSEGLDKKYSHIWTMLLRLRQLCSHILAIQGTISELLEREDWEAIKELTEDQNTRDDECTAHLVQLNHLLATSRELESPDENVETVLGMTSKPPLVDMDSEIDPSLCDKLGGVHGQKYDFAKYIAFASRTQDFKDMEERTKCLACGQTPQVPWVTSCHHIYCGSCLEQLGEKASRRGQESAKCLQCNTEYTEAHAVDDSALQDPSASPAPSDKRRKKSKNDDTADWIKDVKGEVLPSAKTLALKAQIMQWLEEDPDGKIIVFTQFMPLIRILSKVCDAEKWGYQIYWGKDSQEARAEVIEKFQSDPNSKILLASLKCGGIGLNLTMASRVALLDPWWNKATEAQSYCRVYRIGQTKETTMTRFVVTNTVEDKIMDLKRRKQIEIDGVMENRKAVEKLPMNELLRLFGDVEERGGRQFVIPEDDDRDDEDRAPEYVDCENEEEEDDEAFGFSNDA